MELKEYLDRFSNRCFLCSNEMTERHMVADKIILGKYPDHAEPLYIHYYCVCTECYERRQKDEQMDL